MAAGPPVPAIARPNHPLADKPSYKWLATTAVMFGMMGSVMSSTMVNIAIPDIMGAYGIGQDQAHWMSTAFLCAMPVTMLTNGWFVDNFGARNTFIGACIVFSLAALVGQFIPSYWGLVVVRTVQGACGGLLQPLTMSIIFPLFPPAERGRAMAIYFMGFVIGPAMGPAVGGVLVDYANRRDVFGASIPLMVVAGVLGARYLPYRSASATRPRLNWLSLSLIALSIGAFLTGISNGPRADCVRCRRADRARPPVGRAPLFRAQLHRDRRRWRDARRGDVRFPLCPSHLRPDRARVHRGQGRHTSHGDGIHAAPRLPLGWSVGPA